MFKYSKLLFTTFILSMLLIMGCSSIQENNYSVPLKQIKNKEYKQAMNNLMKDIEYKDSKILYSYCQYKVLYNEGKYTLAEQCLDKIPNNYSGDLKEEILKEKNIENKIKRGFELIDASKYEEAISLFSPLIDKDKSLESLINYTYCIIYNNKGDIRKANDYAHRIENYTGYGKERVNSYKDQFIKETEQKVQEENKAIQAELQKTEAEKAQEIQQQIAEHKARQKSEGVRIGMTKQQVLDSSWGKPGHINTTTTANGTHEQWVYGGGNYLYFDNGILTAIQN